MTKIRVMLVDDSGLVRKILTQALSDEPQIEICGEAPNGKEAINRLEEFRPNLVILDVEMPDLNGLDTLREIRRRQPRLPVVMFSTLTERGALATLDALCFGANDYVHKPTNSANLNESRELLRKTLVPKVKALCGLCSVAGIPVKGIISPLPNTPIPGKVGPFPTPIPGSRSEAASLRQPGSQMGSSVDALSTNPQSTTALAANAELQPTRSAPSKVVTPTASNEEKSSRRTRPDCILVGVSTGGPQALQSFLSGIPKDLPVPMLIVQHMPPVFTKLLADRLMQTTGHKVREAIEGVELLPGRIWMAPGDFHMEVLRDGPRQKLHLHQGPHEHSCRPAVDVLFRSAVRVYGKNLLGVILTGMGSDGLGGCEAIKQAGGKVFIQDEASSVVWGMPGAVYSRGLADAVHNLSGLSEAVARSCMISTR